ncbi:MAG: hypothetical protein AAFN77_10995 [Planctomycetota bacterium]
MSSSHLNIDPAQLQQFVDGELPHEQRRSMLLEIEQSDGGWKCLALAFVEQQVVNESVASYFDQPLSNAEINRCDIKPPGRGGSVSRTRLFWSLVGLIVGVLIGTYWISNWFPNQSPSSIASVSVARLSAAPVDRAEHSPAQPQLTLADAIARSAAPIPMEFRREMLKAGYVVDEEQRTTEVDLPHGGTVQVPVRTVEIKFLGLAAYQ